MLKAFSIPEVKITGIILVTILALLVISSFEGWLKHWFPSTFRAYQVFGWAFLACWVSRVIWLSFKHKSSTPHGSA